MKKYICFLFTCGLIISNVVASPITYERTEDNLQISSDIVVTSYNKDIILNTPKVDETEKVYDFANLLSDSQEKLLFDEINLFISNSNLDMAVVTIDDNPKNSAQDYADDFYDYNYFGTGNTHDGVLFLIDMDTREMWISTTGTAQITYDDYRIERILDATYDEIVNEDYYGCALAFVEKTDYYFGLGTPESNNNAYIDEDGDYIYEGYKSSEFDMTFLIISFIISLVVVLIMKSRHKTIKKATTAVAYMKSKSITHREDRFLTTNTVKVYDPPSSSSSSGGSSSHRSSSGRSHGGGGRRF